MPNIRSGGFTLLELIIALSIIAISAVISIPLFSTMIKSHRIAGVAENIKLAIDLARTEAIKRNANVYLSFNTGDNWCYGINVGSSCNCASVGSCSLLTESAPSAQQITLSSSGYSGNYVYFEGTHGAANASGSITLTLYQESNLITISIGRLGYTQLCSTGIGGYAAC